LKVRVAQLHAELDSLGGPRPTLRGSPVPGNAWDDYFQGILEAARIENLPLLRKYAYRLKDGDPELVRPVLLAHGSAVDWMQRGTHRSEVHRVRFHEEEEPFALADDKTRLGKTFSVNILALCRARFLEEAGKDHDALVLLLDLCMFGRDVAADGSTIAHMTGLGICSYAVYELKELLDRGKLSTADCLQMDRELGQLDDAFPGLSSARLGELEWFGERVLEGGYLSVILKGKALPQEARPGWRHAFSVRLMELAAFEESDAMLAAMRDADSGLYSDEKARWQRFQKEAVASKNAMARMFLPMASTSTRHIREFMTKVRLLRTAAHFRATGEILELADPLGTTLLHRLEPMGLRIWGVGRDGKDDGGKGEWERNGDDIVLEIARRK
jgi:hypothetical protein